MPYSLQYCILRKCLLGGVGVAVALWKELGLFRGSINAVHGGGLGASLCVQIHAGEALQLRVRFIIHWQSRMGMTKRRDTTVRQPTRWISTRVGVGQAKQFGRSKLLEQNSKSRAAGVWRSGGGLLFHVIGLSRCQFPAPADAPARTGHSMGMEIGDGATV